MVVLMKNAKESVFWLAFSSILFQIRNIMLVLSYACSLRVQVNKGQRVGAPPRKFFFRGSNLPPLGGPPSQIESARHRYFWPKWAAKVTHRINKAFQKPIF